MLLQQQNLKKINLKSQFKKEKKIKPAEQIYLMDLIIALAVLYTGKHILTGYASTETTSEGQLQLGPE
jgi:hypothetical protein